MKIMGIDLAGLEKNDTGVCVFQDKSVITKIVHSDDDILKEIEKEKPELICIDGPLSPPKSGVMRQCDSALRGYGIIPPLVGGMRCLTERGIRLRQKLCDRYTILEVFNTATAKILGFYDTNPTKRQRSLIGMGITGDVDKRKLTKDEVDSITAAIVGHLYSEGKVEAVGDDEGKITIPVV